MTRFEQDIDRNSWDSFLSAQCNGNIFQTRMFHEIYRGNNLYSPLLIAARKESGSTTGILQAVIQKEKKFGPFTARAIIWGGPVIENMDLEVLEKLLVEYDRRIRGKAIYSQFRNLWEWSPEEKQVFERNGFTYQEHLDIHIRLDRDPEEILMDMHQGRRKNIRRAEKLPLAFREINEVHDFEKSLELIEQTYRRITLPLPDRKFFKHSAEVLGKNDNLKKFGAWFNGELIASRYVLCYNKMIYDWYAGADEKHLDKYPNDFLPWKIMEWGSINGFTLFDFGGAGKPSVPYGVRDYKLKFGGTLVNFGRFQKIHNKMLYSFGEIGLRLKKRYLKK